MAGSAGTELARFARAVSQLHANILGGYSDWCAALQLPERVPEVEHHVLAHTTGAPVCTTITLLNLLCLNRCMRHFAHHISVMVMFTGEGSVGRGEG